MCGGEFVARPAHRDEPGQAEQLLPVLPGQDGRERIGAGDEVQLRVGMLLAQVTQRVDGVGGGAAVDVDPADGESRVGRRRDDRHEVAILGRTDVSVRLLPGLARRDEDHLFEAEPIGNLAGGDEVTVVDRVERAAHDAEPSTRRAGGTGGTGHGQAAYGSAQTGSRPATTAVSCFALRHSNISMTLP